MQRSVTYRNVATILASRSNTMVPCLDIPWHLPVAASARVIVLLHSKYCKWLLKWKTSARHQVAFTGHNCLRRFELGGQQSGLLPPETCIDLQHVTKYEMKNGGTLLMLECNFLRGYGNSEPWCRLWFKAIHGQWLCTKLKGREWIEPWQNWWHVTKRIKANPHHSRLQLRACRIKWTNIGYLSKTLKQLKNH